MECIHQMFIQIYYIAKVVNKNSFPKVGVNIRLKLVEYAKGKKLDDIVFEEAHA